MKSIEIDATANQQFSVTVDGNRWDFVIKQAVTSMISDIRLNDLDILTGIRIVAETPFIPYKHLQGSGNFILLTERDEIPYWQLFGVDQFMVYASAAEIAAL